MSYTLDLPKDVALQLRGCRASIRRAIEARLEDIVTGAGAAPKPRRTGPHEPVLRFYVFEGYRVSYQVDPSTHRVVVLDLRPDFA